MKAPFFLNCIGKKLYNSRLRLYFSKLFAWKMNCLFFIMMACKAYRFFSYLPGDFLKLYFFRSYKYFLVSISVKCIIKVLSKTFCGYKIYNFSLFAIVKDLGFKWSGCVFEINKFYTMFKDNEN